MIDFTNCPKDEPWMLFDNDGNCRILNNVIEFDNARLQIVKEKLDGYFLVNIKEFINNPNNYKKYCINNTGNVEGYPLNMFFASDEQLLIEILNVNLWRNSYEDV